MLDNWIHDDGFFYSSAGGNPNSIKWKARIIIWPTNAHFICFIPSSCGDVRRKRA